jgi:DNA polymerase III epsilon subunit-like protein
LKNEIFIWDCETTDLPKRNDVPDFTEIAVWNLKKGTFRYTKVSPSKPQSMGAILASGLDPSMLKDAPTTKEALKMFFAFVDVPNSVLVAHNGKRFDFKILAHWKSFYGLQTNHTITEVDSLTICRRLPEKMPKPAGRLVLNQKAIYHHFFGANPDHMHCAFFDTWVLARILLHLADDDWRKLDSLILSSTPTKSNSLPGCNCKTSCKTDRCSCHKTQQGCTGFCGCQKSPNENMPCVNPYQPKENEDSGLEIEPIGSEAETESAEFILTEMGDTCLLDSVFEELSEMELEEMFETESFLRIH